MPQNQKIAYNLKARLAETTKELAEQLETVVLLPKSDKT